MRLRTAHAAIIYFVCLTCLGLAIIDDYGISWDEAIQRRHGRVSLDYAAEKLGLPHEDLEPTYDLEDYQWSNYGMLYQLTSSLLELKLGLEDDPFAYYRLRHLLAFGLFIIALICFYRMLRLRWPDRPWYPLLGTVMLTLSPRIFAHAFFNPKDHLLLVFYLIATYTLLRFLRHRTWPALLLHAFTTALALNTRLPALLILLATVLILVWEQLTERPPHFRRLGMAVVYTVVSFAVMVPFFPYLWEDTLTRLVGAFTEMSDFEWAGSNLLFGDRLSALAVPAYYIPTWIAITTPVVYVLLILTGIGRTLRNMFQGVGRGRMWTNYFEQADFVALGLSVGPILVVIILQSTLYNAWRHLHFVYPGMVFLALSAFAYWRTKIPRLSTVLLALSMTVTLVDMVRYHPHQYVYFNNLIHGKPLMGRFDMDYWGVGFRDALTRLAKTVPEGETRTILCNDWPCRDNLLALPDTLRGRLRYVPRMEDADYFATNFLYDDAGKAFRHEDRYAQPVIELTPAGILTIGVYAVQKQER